MDVQMTSTNDIPDPMSVCSRTYAEACMRAGRKGGEVGAIARYRRLYREGVSEQEGLRIQPPRLGRVQESESAEGIVRKFTLALGAAQEGVYERAAAGVTLETESVVIPMIGKKRIRTHTLCVSSQVGCAMGCTFCQTAQMGLVRNLTAAEIVRQWWAARWMVGRHEDGKDKEINHGEHREHRGETLESESDPALDPKSELSFSVPSMSSVVNPSGYPSIRNVVFMGMGEPMDNLDAVLGAIKVLTDRNGANLPMSKVTISTVGRVDGLSRLAEKVHEPGWHRLNLAVSLNAPTDAVREAIMPINRRYSMAELRGAIERWPIYGAAKICFEYVMIPGVNDGREHAVQLGDYVLGRGEWAGRAALPGLVNLIPYNPREGSPWGAPEEGKVDEFLGWLTETGVYAKRRRTKGRDTMAACGQLGNLEFRKRGRVGLTVGATGGSTST
jgi:23S rRNA (adenine2503-C2)-methyltransferase